MIGPPATAPPTPYPPPLIVGASRIPSLGTQATALVSWLPVPETAGLNQQLNAPKLDQPC